MDMVTLTAPAMAHKTIPPFALQVGTFQRRMPDPSADRSDGALHPRAAVRVLVVDDNEINQVVACKFLQKLGCHVEVACTGREAVESTVRTFYDAVLMDCEMPDMDGYEATKAIRLREAGSGRHLPIIALTGHAGMDDAEKCRAAGMDAVVTKPVMLPTLRATLQRLIPAFHPPHPT